MLEKLKGYLAKVKSPRILDIATGKGSFIEIIRYICDDYSEIIGIDNSPKAIEMANRNIKEPRVSFIQMDINEITFEKNSFDIVCLSNSIHHMNNINDCIDKMSEMVKPGGILLFNEMISDNSDEAQMTHTYIHHFWAEIDRLNGVVHKKTMKKQEILDVFTSNTKVLIDQTWELIFEDEEEITKEAYDWLKNTLEKSLDRIKGFDEYPELEKRAQELEVRLDTIGFKPATQVIVVVKLNK